MKQSVLIRLDGIMENIKMVHFIIGMALGAVILSPFYIIFKVWDYVSEWLEKKKRKTHVIPDKKGKFLFEEDRKLVMEYNELVYVETTYNEWMHRFLDNNAKWLDKWQKWHGCEIKIHSSEEIKEGMMYEEDFAVFEHGFLWRSPSHTYDNVSERCGYIYMYYEMTYGTDAEIKEQMELMMSKIYNEIDL